MKNGSRLRIGFRGKKQLPLFMLWREYWYNGEVVAKTVFVIYGQKARSLLKQRGHI